MPSYTREVPVPGRSAQELYDTVSKDIDRFMTKASIGKFDIERDPAARAVRVKTSMADVSLCCLDGKLRMDAKLSLLATPFRSKLDQGIDRWLAKAFGPAPTG